MFQQRQTKQAGNSAERWQQNHISFKQAGKQSGTGTRQICTVRSGDNVTTGEWKPGNILKKNTHTLIYGYINRG